MARSYDILILGASYGSLLATKALLAGHNVTLACLPAEAELINAEGTRVRLPIKGRDGLVEIDSRTAPGKLAAATPEEIDPAAFDLVALAMQEPQYRADAVRNLLKRVAEASRPCMSIMNMPPLPYLARIPSIDVATIAKCYTDAGVWEPMDPALVTLASPDPQAFRPPEEPLNVLQVALPTNFKVARFADDAPTQILRDLEADIQAVRYDAGDGPIELPVKLRVHDSLFVPMAKWSMLVAGNYRCVGDTSMRSIREAVHSDLEASRAVYEWVGTLCQKLGADPRDLVPFDKYAAAANGLAKPSSAARALAAGAPYIERVDCLVQTLAAENGMQLDEVDRIVARVDGWLTTNRKAA